MDEKKIPTPSELVALKANTLAAQKASDHAAKHEGLSKVLDAATDEAAAWREYAEGLEAYTTLGTVEPTSAWQQSAERILEQMRRQNGLDPKPYESENGVRYAIGQIVFATIQFKPRPQYIQEREPYEKLFAEAVDPPEQVLPSWLNTHVQAGSHKPVQHRDGKEPWCRACGKNAEGKEPASRFERPKYEDPTDVLMEMAADQQMESQEDPPTPQLDPTPWVFISDQVFGTPRSPVDQGYHDVSGTWWAFQPRPEYSQNREDYPTPLDPKPWRYDRLPNIPVGRRAREAEQVTGGFSFAPRPGYVQNREDYK